MIIRNGFFSSESVSEGHPDKLAGRISDRILDAFLERDSSARVACETMVADQGLMFGYACNDTPELMRAPIAYAHRLVRQQAALRKSGILPWLQPDAKSQVTFRYVDGHPTQIETVVLSTQHDADVDIDQLRVLVREHIVDAVIPKELRAPGFNVLINPTGRFVTGSPRGDVGLTGRKIIVETYGGAAPHGGWAFSGKDPSNLADEFDLTPQGIIDRLDLQRPIYYPTAAYGHFSRIDRDLPWESCSAS